MQALIYDLAIGQIRSQFTCSVEEEVQLQCSEAEGYVLTFESMSDKYIDIDTKEVLDIPLKSDIYQEFNWQTKVWEHPTEYLLQAKTDNKKIVNLESGAKIIDRYPTYRQMNYNRDPTAQATIDMNFWIDEVRAESNVATSSIDLATDLATIEGIVEGFKAYLAGL